MVDVIPHAKGVSMGKCIQFNSIQFNSKYLSSLKFSGTLGYIDGSWAIDRVNKVSTHLSFSFWHHKVLEGTLAIVLCSTIPPSCYDQINTNLLDWLAGDKIIKRLKNAALNFLIPEIILASFKLLYSLKCHRLKKKLCCYFSC